MALRVLTQIMEVLFSLVRTVCGSKADLAMEALALRQQLAAYRRKNPRPRLDNFDRLFWVALKDQFAGWADALIIVKPDTVVRWHREAFRKHWAMKSARPPGRPEIGKDIRDLVRKMATANHFNVTANPTARWTAQQIVEAFPGDTATPKYLMRDRDGIYGDYFVHRVAGMGIEEVKSAPRSPWQNPCVERIIGSIRSDCLDHVIVLNEWHLRRILRSYFDYYHNSRTHLAQPVSR